MKYFFTEKKSLEIWPRNREPMVTILPKQCPGQAETATHKFKKPALTKNEKIERDVRRKRKMIVEILAIGERYTDLST